MEQCPWVLFDAWVKILEPYFWPLFFFFFFLSQSTSGISANSVIIALKIDPNLPISHHLCCQHFRLAYIIFHFECCCTAFQLTSHSHLLYLQRSFTPHTGHSLQQILSFFYSKSTMVSHHTQEKNPLRSFVIRFLPFFFWGFCFCCLFYCFHSHSLDSSCTGF